MKWQQAIEKIRPYIVGIRTSQGAGTGFFLEKSATHDVVGVATASHVINHADTWKEGIRIRHYASGKEIYLESDKRVIDVDKEKDTATILFSNKIVKMPFPGAPLELVPEGKRVKLGVEIGWLGFPAISRKNLCFFSGRTSCWLEGEGAYLVDGVAINGVSGGPAFYLPDDVDLRVIGIVTHYIANRATGETLPGLCVIQDVSPFQKKVKLIRNLGEAKKEEQRKKDEQAKDNPPPAAIPGA